MKFKYARGVLFLAAKDIMFAKVVIMDLLV
jgi:hypothetical protein